MTMIPGICCIQEPSWPTPSGWTKANATAFCEDFIKNSKAFLYCNSTIDVQADIDMCVEDIKVSSRDCFFFMKVFC